MRRGKRLKPQYFGDRLLDVRSLNSKVNSMSRPYREYEDTLLDWYLRKSEMLLAMTKLSTSQRV